MSFNYRFTNLTILKKFINVPYTFTYKNNKSSDPFGT